RGQVDRLAGREGRIGGVDHDLAGLDADAGLQLELADGLQDGHRGANRARARRAFSMRRAAEIARSASSSCACATPNAARTASPANFSTIPPWVVTQCVTSSKNRVTRRRTISGSAALISSVEPTRSTNRTVASFRSIPEL